MANISFLLNHFPAGGVERVTMNLIPPLTYEKGHKIFIFVCKLDEDKLAGCDMPVTFIKLPYRTTDKRNKDIIAKAVRKYNIDLFISPIISPKYLFELRKENICKVCYFLHGVPFYELKEIENGFHILNIPISEEHKQRIISLSNNIASVAHQLCLNICHNLSYTNMTFFNVPTITDETIDCSIKDYINEKSSRFKSLLDRVLAIKKDRNIGKKILKLFIDVDFEGVYVDDVYKNFKTFPQDTIKEVLDSLCTSKYDEAFRYDEDSGKLKLVNPFFQVYIKMYFVH